EVRFHVGPVRAHGRTRAARAKAAGQGPDARELRDVPAVDEHEMSGRFGQQPLIEGAATEGDGAVSGGNKRRVHDRGKARKAPVFVARRRKTSSLEGLNRGFPDA